MLERIKGLITPKNLFLIRLLEEGNIKEVIDLCQDRLSRGEDLETRAVLSLALLRLGYSVLAQEEVRHIRELLERNLEVHRILSQELLAPSLLVEETLPQGEEFLPEEMGPQVKEMNLEEPGVVALKDLSTPSLAELYVEQGAIREAINVYENYILANPSDQVAQERLKELKAQLEEPNKRLIRVLERWLEGIRITLSEPLRP